MPPDQTATDELLDAEQAIGLTLSDQQRQQLLAHLELLGKWNQAYNLTAIRDPSDMRRQHLFDSLAVIPALLRQCAGAPKRLLDVGSGAGFPGLSLAVALPDTRITCVDSVGKKAGFMRQVIAELGLGNATAEHARIEQLPEAGADVVTSRAFASLADFTSLTARHLSPAGVWMAMKGKVPDDEIADLPTAVEVFHVEQLQVPGVPGDRCLVWMRPRKKP